MRRDGDRILNDYNTIYKDRPARDTDSTNEELSDFADDMNNYIRFSEVFSSIGDDIGYLIYTTDMEEGATTEAEKENIDLRKEILQDLDSESKAIRISIKEITKASEAFADKHIGQRNLVAGLTKAEAVIKGLAARFRGVSELPSRALQVLYKLTSTAKNNAASDAFKEVEVLMSLRDKLVARGGDTRKLVQKLYQKTTEGGLVNKLIYKYKKDFFEQIDAKAKEVAKVTFQTDASCRILISSDAGGYGVDLPQANLLINYDLPWNAGLALQRNGRIRRASSTWPSIVIQDFLMAGSIEERQHDMLLQKNAIADAIMDGEGVDATGGVPLNLGSLRAFLQETMV
jgi:superfamily II DNA or RNA helicase